MKKLFLLLAITIATITTTQAQSAQTSTTAWISNDCWKGIEYRFHYTPNNTATYSVQIEFRNRYKIPIKFNFDVIGDGFSSRNNGIYGLETGETDKSYIGTGITTKNLRAIVSGANQTGNNGTADCDN